MDAAAAAGGDGTAAAPFATIQEAADVMQPGDTCLIAAGTYRETVTVRTDEVSFLAMAGQEVILTGLDVVEGWSRGDNGVFQASVDGPVYQLFAAGRRMERARHPNTPSPDLLHPVLGRAVDGLDAPFPELSWIRDPALDIPGVSWTGAQVWILGGSRWVAHTLDIVQHSGDTLYFVHPLGGRYHFRIGSGAEYYISGTLAALDADREWFHDSAAGTLYFDPPGEDLPETMVVEARRRLRGLDFNGHSGVRVSGLTLMAASFVMNGASHSRIDHCRIFYPVPYLPAEGFIRSTALENLLDGENNALEDSVVAYSWTNGVYLDGRNNRVENCRIRDTDWNGTDGALVNVVGDGHAVLHNDLANTARNGVLHGNSRATDMRYNDLRNFGMLCADLGGFYAYQTDGQGTEIAYNWVHDGDPLRRGGVVAGIYADNDSSNMIVHHNVVWKVPEGIRTNTQATGHRFFNNSFQDVGVTMAAWMRDGLTISDQLVFNNVSTEGTFLGTVFGHNMTVLPWAWSLADPARGDLRPVPGSPVVDAGVEIPGITDGFAGDAPDIGAYEYGGNVETAHWLPGVEDPGGPPLFLDPKDAAMTSRGQPGPGDFQASDGDWLRFDAVPLNLAHALIHVSHQGSGQGGVLEVRRDSLDGPLVAELLLDGSGSSALAEALLLRPHGMHDLYLVVRNWQGRLCRVVLSNGLCRRLPLSFGPDGEHGDGLPRILEGAGGDPTRIEIEDYNRPGVRPAYGDSTPGQEPGAGSYRAGESVDTVLTGDEDGGHDVAWTEAGEWLEYSVVSRGGNYVPALRLMPGRDAEAAVRMLVSGNGVDWRCLGEFGAPAGEDYVTLNGPGSVHLPSGGMLLRLEIVAGSPMLNSLILSPAPRPESSPSSLLLLLMPALLDAARQAR